MLVYFNLVGRCHYYKNINNISNTTCDIETSKMRVVLEVSNREEVSMCYLKHLEWKQRQNVQKSINWHLLYIEKANMEINVACPIVK